MIKSLIKNWFYSKGYELRTTVSIPFGVDWHRDLKYLLLNSSEQLKTVFDVGANRGQTAEKVAKYFSESKIYSFEPWPETYRELTYKISHLKNVEAINCALGEKIGKAEMIEKNHSRSATNTLLVERKKSILTKDELKKAKILKVSIDTVDDFCHRRNISQIDLLKIDTEGFEIPVLKGAERMLRERSIKFIFAECSFEDRRDDNPTSDFIELLSYLKNFDFSVVSFYTGIVDNLGWSWGNVLFQLKPENPTLGLAFSPHIPFSPQTKESYYLYMKSIEGRNKVDKE